MAILPLNLPQASFAQDPELTSETLLQNTVPSCVFLIYFVLIYSLPYSWHAERRRAMTHLTYHSGRSKIGYKVKNEARNIAFQCWKSEITISRSTCHPKSASLYDCFGVYIGIHRSVVITFSVHADPWTFQSLNFTGWADISRSNNSNVDEQYALEYDRVQKKSHGNLTAARWKLTYLIATEVQWSACKGKVLTTLRAELVIFARCTHLCIHDKNTKTMHTDLPLWMASGPKMVLEASDETTDWSLERFAESCPERSSVGFNLFTFHFHLFIFPAFPPLFTSFMVFFLSFYTLLLSRFLKFVLVILGTIDFSIILKLIWGLFQPKIQIERKNLLTQGHLKFRKSRGRDRLRRTSLQRKRKLC